MAIHTRLIPIGAAALVFGLLVAGCSDGDGGSSGGGSVFPGAGGGGGGGAGGGGGGAGGGFDCGMTFCGCSSPVTLMFSANVTNGQTMMPAAGIELYCEPETSPVAVSDAMGKVTFSVETMESPGCGPERCGNLRLHDPAAALPDTKGSYFELNGKDIVMQ